MHVLTKLIISAFGAGFLFWPGFWGSWVGFAMAWFCPQYFLWILFSSILLGYAMCMPAQKVCSNSDPQIFVLDEVCGMLLAVWGLPHDLWVYLAAYVLFRILDVVKPGPIRALERAHHPFSIMNDDVAAGLSANLMLRLLLVFCPAI